MLPGDVNSFGGDLLRLAFQASLSEGGLRRLAILSLITAGMTPTNVIPKLNLLLAGGRSVDLRVTPSRKMRLILRDLLAGHAHGQGLPTTTQG